METPHRLTLNRASTIGMIALSSAALMTVVPFVAVNILAGHVAPPPADEGTAEHLFQLAIAALIPTGLIFLATAEWTRPLGVARKLALPAALALLALCTVVYIENFYYPAHGFPSPRPGLPAILVHRLLTVLR